MRLLALTATALLGTGCFVSSTNSTPGGDVNVYWDFIRHTQAGGVPSSGSVTYDASLGAVNTSGICPESDVDTVRVSSAAGTFDIACTGPAGGGAYVQGAVVHGLPIGTRTITLLGYRSSVLVYQTSVSVDVLANSTVTAPTAHLEGVQAPLDVFADLAFGTPGTLYASCAAAGSPNITYTLTDSLGTLVASGTAGCSDPLPSLTFRDQLDLDSYTVRLKGLRVSDNALVFDACNKTLQHFGSQTGAGGFAPTLFTLPVPTCP
ncbi:MAG TPA: hypothetical protein VFP50_14350 [Anaeromyxobacteraceae bacterium]|nr:hypothetical protein [Anaeromyxobacteraceae bacterium]